MHRCFSAYNLITLCTLLLPFAYHLFLHLLSTNDRCTQPCYFPYCTNRMLRRWWWTRILRRGVLGYVMPRLLFLWRYGVFRCSTSQESCLVFKDIIYVINILYSWYLAICEHICVCETNDHWHTCDEYLVLLPKSGMTRYRWNKLL
jgi:hypothetical protein